MLFVEHEQAFLVCVNPPRPRSAMMRVSARSSSILAATRRPTVGRVLPSKATPSQPVVVQTTCQVSAGPACSATTNLEEMHGQRFAVFLSLSARRNSRNQDLRKCRILCLFLHNCRIPRSAACVRHPQRNQGALQCGKHPLILGAAGNWTLDRAIGVDVGVSQSRF